MAESDKAGGTTNDRPQKKHVPVQDERLQSGASSNPRPPQAQEKRTDTGDRPSDKQTSIIWPPKVKEFVKEHSDKCAKFFISDLHTATYYPLFKLFKFRRCYPFKMVEICGTVVSKQPYRDTYSFVVNDMTGSITVFGENPLDIAKENRRQLSEQFALATSGINKVDAVCEEMLRYAAKVDLPLMSEIAVQDTVHVYGVLHRWNDEVRIFSRKIRKVGRNAVDFRINWFYECTRMYRDNPLDFNAKYVPELRLGTYRSELVEYHTVPE